MKIALISALSALIAAIPAAGAASPKVVLDTTKGEITIELYPEKAPATVENFLAYVDAGFYNGTIFHRVIPGFMIQGGGFTPDMQQKPTRPAIKIESDNGLKNLRGTVAMARTQDPNSATAQFFINSVDNAFLNFTAKTTKGWGYAVFGKVVKGMEVVDEISKVKTGAKGMHSDVPVDPIMINTAKRAN
jgi:peptidyl-prolyl cis-trans isomerase B (cyclophilin B)